MRQVHEELSRRANVGYTTVLKLLQIMTDKGLVVRDASQRAHVYQPRISEEDTQRHLLDDLVDRAFGGSAGRLVMQALASQPASEAELAQIRRLLDDMQTQAGEGDER